MFQEERELSFHEAVVVCDGAAERLRRHVAVVCVCAPLLILASIILVGSTIGGCIEYVGWSFADMLIVIRRQYLPDLCNDLLYSGVRLLRKIRKETSQF